MSDLSGKTIGNYVLGEPIGEGGMGTVYVARHSMVGKKVALKLLKAKHAEDDEVVKRMLREARAAAAIGHPNIVMTHDFGITPEGDCYLVMDYLQGQSLGDLVRHAGALAAPAVVLIMSQVLSALEAAHAKGIAHRDLKPENVFLARMPRGGEEVKLLDFGISKLVGREDLRLTQTGAVMGTPYYMSPEQAAGKSDIDTRTDLWSAGVILYECLSQRTPFLGENYNAVMYHILNGDPLPLRAVRSDLSEALEGVVMRALKKDRTERFETAEEMRQALRETPEALPVADSLLRYDEEVTLTQLAVTPTGHTNPDVVPVLPARESLETIAPAEIFGSTLRPRRRSSRLKVLGGIGGAVLLVWLTVVLVVLRAGPHEGGSAQKKEASKPPPSEQTRTPPRIVDPDMRPTARTPATPMRPRQAAFPMLNLALKGLPPHATVRLDGGPETAPPVTLPADGKRHKLLVIAPGHQSKVVRFTARDGLKKLVVSLEPLPRRRTVRTRVQPRRRPRRAGPRPRPRTTKNGLYTDPYGVR